MVLSDFIRNKFLKGSSNINILSNIAWAMLGKFVNLLSGLVVGIMVARYLGPEQYGLMNYVISVVFFFHILSVFGLDNIEIREEAKGVVDKNTIIGTSLVIRIVLGIACIVLCILTSLVMDADKEVTTLVAVYSSTIVFNSFIVTRNYFYAIVKNKRVVQSEIARTLICMVLKLLLLLFKASLFWFIVASIMDVIIVQLGYMAAYRREIGSMREWRFDKTYVPYLLRESFPLLLSNAAVVVYQRIDQVMIGQLLDKEAVGYFSVASRLVEILIYLPMILSQTISPVLTKERQNNPEHYTVKGQQFMNISVWGSLLISAFMSICAYWLVVLLFGEAYIPAVVVLQIMAFKTASVALSNTAGAMLVVEGLQKNAILRDGLGCIACVVLNYLLLPRYGVVAAAFVAIASNVVAGYLADALIPTYRHLFVMQTKALLMGWKDIFKILELKK